jgi:hypothetical protein
MSRWADLWAVVPPTKIPCVLPVPDVHEIWFLPQGFEDGLGDAGIVRGTIGSLGVQDPPKPFHEVMVLFLVEQLSVTLVRDGPCG